jgi:cell division protein FtsB
MKLPKIPTFQQVWSRSSGFAEKAIVLVVVVYVVVSVGRSVMQNYEINQRITNLKRELVMLDQEKAYHQNLNAYYQTQTFKELKAREELGLQKEGEQVISVPIDPNDKPLSAEESLLVEEVKKEEAPAPNYQKWFIYFFGNG